MARVREVKRAREAKERRVCRQCQREVAVGESYKYVSKKSGPRSGYTLFWCYRHSPRHSDLLSGRAAELAAIQEGFVASSRATPEDMGSALEQYASDLVELADEIRSGAENMEEGFGHPTAQTEAMIETADGIQELADEVEAHALELPDDEDPAAAEWLAEGEELGAKEVELNLQG